MPEKSKLERKKGLRLNEKAKKPPGSEHGTSFELNVVKWQGSSGI